MGNWEGRGEFPSIDHFRRGFWEGRLGCSAICNGGRGRLVTVNWRGEKGVKGTNSRILDSEGCAIMYGGGFCWIVWYSRVS